MRPSRRGISSSTQEASTGFAPGKPEGYHRLVVQYGVERVADALLAKWISDNDADEKWEHLAAVIEVREPESRQPALQQLVVLYLLSHGRSVPDVAAELGKSLHTIQRQVKQAKESMRIPTTGNTQAVATAIRLGYIP